MTLDTDTRAAFKAAAGERGWSEDRDEIAPHLAEWRGRYRGASPLLLKPGSVAEAAAIVRLANDKRVALVPQGGNTGLVAGGIPDASGDELLISLKRMTAIRRVDAEAFSLVAEAGASLQAVQEAAARAERLFPLSLASEGTATVGGVCSTNAGGVHVLKYGTTRELVLGLEAVLPTGAVWHGLTSLRKDNTGYDLKSLLVGAEGTLGLITAAAFKLFPALASREVALAALPSPGAAVTLLSRLRAASGDRVIAFELMPRFGLELVTGHMAGCRDPFDRPHPWYALVELASSEAEAGLRRRLEAGLADGLARGLVADAVIADSLERAGALWALRHNMSEAQRHAGGSIKHDVSVPVSDIPAFLEQADALARRLVPGVRPCPFGHVGDGNLHYNLTQPEGADKDEFLARWDTVSAAIHDLIVRFGGSIAAEHGIGRLKVGELERLKDPAALAAMKAVKRALDPNGVMNPGRVLSL